MADIPVPLISEEAINRRIAELGRQISSDYHGRDLTVLVVLKGGAIFFADLARRITLPARVEFFAVSSYKGRESSGTVAFQETPLPDLAGRHVLVVDDILDTGATLTALCGRLRKESHARDIQTCILLRKTVNRRDQVRATYVGFDIPEVFVVGYGMDLDEQYRNLPYIAVMETPSDAPEAVKVHVEYFDILRESAGIHEEVLSLSAPATVGALVSEVLKRHPSLLSQAGRIVVTSGLDYVEPGHFLTDGEKIGLIPGDKPAGQCAR